MIIRSSGARSAPGRTCTAIGGKYPDAWHYNHMDDPRSTSPGSIMPRYPWLLTQKLDTIVAAGAHQRAAQSRRALSRRLRKRRRRRRTLQAQAAKVVMNLQGRHRSTRQTDREIIALIAYLQRLGTDIKAAPAAPAPQRGWPARINPQAE